MQLQFSHIEFIAEDFVLITKQFLRLICISILHAPTIPIVSEVFHDIATLECNYGLVFNFDVEITVMWLDYPQTPT